MKPPVFALLDLFHDTVKERHRAGCRRPTPLVPRSAFLSAPGVSSDIVRRVYEIGFRAGNRAAFQEDFELGVKLGVNGGYLRGFQDGFEEGETVGKGIGFQLGLRSVAVWTDSPRQKMLPS